MKNSIYSVLSIVSGTIFFVVSLTFGGSLEPAGSPGEGSSLPTLTDIYNRLDTGSNIAVSGSFQEPAAGPAGSGNSLSEIQSKLPLPDNTWGLMPGEAPAGKTFWGLNKDGGAWGPQTGNNPNLVDTGSGNVSAYQMPAGVKAWAGGQEITGTLKLRFFDNYDGTVTDINTGLVWLKNAWCTGSYSAWSQAMSFVAVLASGQCGLTDGSTAGQWRLPELWEWQGLANTAYSNPALSNGPGTGQWTSGNVFTNVRSSAYWSATSYFVYPTLAFYVDMTTGVISFQDKGYPNIIWPVRNGP